MGPHDHVLRAVTEDGSFRVIAALTTETVSGVLDTQHTEPAFAQRLCDLVTSAVLVRETMAPDLRVQVILSDGKRNRLIADALPDGRSRGLAQLSKTATAATLDDMVHLQVMRSLQNGSLNQGLVRIERAQSVADALMEYFRVSEQIASFVAIGTRMVGPVVQASAGYVVQLLPEVTEAPLQLMTERLDHFPKIDELLTSAEAHPQKVLSRILADIPHKQTSESALSFGCNCSSERILTGLATLPQHDLAELASSKEPLEMTCDYCGREYKIVPDMLRGMLANN